MEGPRTPRVGAANAKAAGFDEVEIGQRLSPAPVLSSATNLRTDRYGSFVENRVRFLQEIVEAAISAFPSARVSRPQPRNGSGSGIDLSACAAMLDAKAIGDLHVADPRFRHRRAGAAADPRGD